MFAQMPVHGNYGVFGRNIVVLLMGKEYCAVHSVLRHETYNAVLLLYAVLRADQHELISLLVEQTFKLLGNCTEERMVDCRHKQAYKICLLRL